MATRSTIALEYADGTVDCVYVHWDGYIGHNGQILFEHYQDPFKVQKLMDNGAISSLGKEIGEKHPFDRPYSEKDPLVKAVILKALQDAEEAGWTTFYARDRGEDLQRTRHRDFDAYQKNQTFEEYNYILRTDGKWYVSTNGKFVDLATEVAAISE